MYQCAENRPTDVLLLHFTHLLNTRDIEQLNQVSQQSSKIEMIKEASSPRDEFAHEIVSRLEFRKVIRTSYLAVPNHVRLSTKMHLSILTHMVLIQEMSLKKIFVTFKGEKFFC